MSFRLTFSDFVRKPLKERRERLNKAVRQAIFDQDAQQVEAALKAGGDPNAPDDIGGFTMLHSAAVRENTAVIAVLLKGGADITATTTQGMTAMHLAARSGHAGVITLLAAHGADPEAQDTNNDTPLHLAMFYGNGDAAVALLKLGVDPDLEHISGRERPTGVHENDLREATFKYSTTLGLMHANRLKSIRLKIKQQKNRRDRSERQAPVNVTQMPGPSPVPVTP